MLLHFAQDLRPELGAHFLSRPPLTRLTFARFRQFSLPLAILPEHLPRFDLLYPEREARCTFQWAQLHQPKLVRCLTDVTPGLGQMPLQHLTGQLLQPDGHHLDLTLRFNEYASPHSGFK